MWAFTTALVLSPRLAAQELSADAQRVVDYLVEDWSKQFRSTSIPLAMENLGIAPNGDLRLEVLEHLRAHRELANNLRLWGANNYVLTNEERRLAKYVVGVAEGDQHTLRLEDMAAALAIPQARLPQRLAFLARVGFLQGDRAQPAGYSLVSDYKPWAGPLQHNFHTVRIDGEAPFDVW